jgi:hypothetical protein
VYFLEAGIVVVLHEVAFAALDVKILVEEEIKEGRRSMV